MIMRDLVAWRRGPAGRGKGLTDAQDNVGRCAQHGCPSMRRLAFVTLVTFPSIAYYTTLNATMQSDPSIPLLCNPRVLVCVRLTIHVLTEKQLSQRCTTTRLDRLAGDVLRLLRCKEGDELRDILGLLDATEQDISLDALGFGLADADALLHVDRVIDDRHTGMQ